MQPSRSMSAREDTALTGALSHLVGVAAALALPIDAIFSALVKSGLAFDALCAYLGLTREVAFSAVIRLGLPTPSEKPLRKPSGKGWTVDDIQKLIAWRSTGVHPEVIGQNLSLARSANAVRSKSRRLGLSAPSRKSLFRPLPERLTLALCLSAHPAKLPCLDTPILPTARANLGFGISPLLRLTPSVTPKSIDEIDISDLTWVGLLRGRRGRPNAGVDGVSTNRVAAHVFGLVTCAGVNRFDAAKLLGLSVDSYRTLRTRLGLPPIAKRSSFTNVFDVEVAEETIKRSGLELITSIRRTEDRPPQLFWRFRDERHVRLAPTERPQRARGEPTFSRPMTIFTRSMIDTQDRLTPTPPLSAPPHRLILQSSRPARPSSPSPDFFIPSNPFATACVNVGR